MTSFFLIKFLWVKSQIWQRKMSLVELFEKKSFFIPEMKACSSMIEVEVRTAQIFSQTIRGRSEISVRVNMSKGLQVLLVMSANRRERKVDKSPFCFFCWISISFSSKVTGVTCVTELILLLGCPLGNI